MDGPQAPGRVYGVTTEIAARVQTMRTADVINPGVPAAKTPWPGPLSQSAIFHCVVIADDKFRMPAPDVPLAGANPAITFCGRISTCAAIPS